MSSLSAYTALLIVPCILTSACASADTTEELGVSEQEVVSSNRMSLNRLSLNRLSLNSLSSARLSNDGLTLTQTDLLATADGRELLRYIAGCALPMGSQLSGTVDSVTYTFQGSIGLAPQWLEGGIKAKEQKWVSACLLAHVNGYGVATPISLRGKHVALVTDALERTSFSDEEISFYGNVFVPAVDGDHKMYSCGGQNIQSKCGGSEDTFNPTRSCATNADCALHFVGPCRSATPSPGDACEDTALTGYSKCHSVAKDAEGKWPKDTGYAEVITVYLQPVSFSSFYPSCTSL